MGTRVIVCALALSACGPGPVRLEVFGPGAVSITSTGQRCKSTCEVPWSSALQFNAEPEANATFVGWSGICSGNLLCSPKSGGTLQARFEPTITIEIVGPGKVDDGAGRSCSSRCTWIGGEPLLLVATPDPGAEFETFDGACTGQSPCRIATGSIKAVFRRKQPKLSLRFGGDGGGTVTSGSGLACSSTCEVSGIEGELVELHSTPDESSLPGQLLGSGCNGPSCTVRVPSVVDVRFDPAAVIRLRVEGMGEIRGDAGTLCNNSCSLKRRPGEMLQLEAIPAQRWVLDSWTERCADAGSLCSLSLEPGTTEIVARFRPLVISVATMTVGAADSGTGIGYRSVLVGTDGGIFTSILTGSSLTVGNSTFVSSPSGQLTVFSRFLEDGGVAWATAIPSILPDAGQDVIVAQQLRETQNRLMAVGQCLAPGRGCATNGLSVMELDSATGTMNNLLRLPLAPLPFPTTRFPEISNCWIGIRNELVRICSGLSNITITTLPFTIGGCTPEGEELRCAASWGTGWSWGGCSGAPTMGLTTPGAMVFNPTSATCSSLAQGAALSSTSSSIIHSLFAFGPESVLLASFDGDSALPWSGTSGPGSNLLLVRNDGFIVAVSAPASAIGGAVGFATRTGAAVVLLPVRQTSAFGIPLAPGQLLYARLDRALKQHSAVIFDNVSDFAADSRLNRTALLVRGRDVTMDGVGLSAVPGQHFHVVLLDE